MSEGKKSGWVAILGRPNAGKSTLLNKVLRSQLSIVTAKAQTTREQLRGILTDERLGQIIFIDTPGIHRAKSGGINEFMVSEAKQALDQPNLVWYVVDPASKLKYEDTVIELLKAAKAPVVIIANKSDVETNPELMVNLKVRCREAGIQVAKMLPLSAKRGRGLDDLMEVTWKHMPEGPLYYPDEDYISDRSERYFVAEIIRKHLYLKLGQELPYSCAVRIDNFKETVNPIRIEATILVERESQKGMVVGKRGHKIKEIGQDARQDVQNFLGQSKIFLGLQVQVLPNWTKDRKRMKQLGYVLPENEKAPGNTEELQ